MSGHSPEVHSVSSPDDAGGIERAVAAGRGADPARFSKDAASVARRLAAADRNVALVVDAHPPAALLVGEIESWDEPDGVWIDLWMPEGVDDDTATRLWSALVAHCRAHGVRGARVPVSAERPDLVGFLSERGFWEAERDQEVTLRMPAWPAPPDIPAGIQIVTLAERPALVDELIEIDRLTVGDIPGEAGVGVVPSDAKWWSSRIADGVVRPSTTVVAVEGGRALAYTVLRHDGRPDAATLEYTATLPEARGRGLAVLVKRAQAVVAWDEGVRELWSWNHLDNAPMRAINQGLGYQRGVDVVMMRVEGELR